jgi:hypothetical protein
MEALEMFLRGDSPKEIKGPERDDSKDLDLPKLYRRPPEYMIHEASARWVLRVEGKIHTYHLR